MTQINLLYLHGFKSSPQSEKARQSQAYFAKHFPQVTFHCPQLPSSPLAAIKSLEKLINDKKYQPWLVMGSSLGGFYATYLSEQFQLKAALINPAIKPYELLVDYIGEQQNFYTKESFYVDQQHMNDLKQIECHLIEKKSYLVMVQTGDEVLDYQQAVDKYQNSQLIVQQGGDHSFIDYQNMLPKIADFFQLR